jgi:hypothetical protein
MTIVERVDPAATDSFNLIAGGLAFGLLAASFALILILFFVSRRRQN